MKLSRFAQEPLRRRRFAVDRLHVVVHIQLTVGS
jgi:hypothetical protein